MNNLKQKNVIYGQDPKDVLPHGGSGASVVFKSNSNVTDARLTNAAKQLVNNDLYVENMISRGAGYQPGPKASDAQASSFPDGTKQWTESDDA